MEANGAAAIEAGSGPHLESLDKIMKIPLIEMTWNQSVGLYGKVKEANGLFRWTLSTAEAAVLKAAEQAYPIAKKLETPIHAMDQTVCKGIEIVEDKIPLIKEPPSHVYEAAKNFVNSAISPTMDQVNAAKDYGTEKVNNIKDASLQKANELLATRYGAMALSGFTTTAALAEKYLDYYFPATQQETEKEPEQPEAEAEEDKVMNTVHTVGRLSNKFACRVYNILSSKVQNLNKDNVQEYVNSMATIMHITNHLTTINENLKAATKAKEGDQKTESPTEKTEVPGPSGDSKKDKSGVV